MKGGFPSCYDWISWLVAASFFRRLYFELLSMNILISPLYWVIHSHDWHWTQVSSDPINIHTHTQTQIVVSSASTALDLLSVFPLSCSDVDQGPTIMLLAPLLCTSHNTNLSQVEVREILMTVFYDSCLTELVNMVVPEYYYI